MQLQFLCANALTLDYKIMWYNSYQNADGKSLA